MTVWFGVSADEGEKKRFLYGKGSEVLIEEKGHATTSFPAILRGKLSNFLNCI